MTVEELNKILNTAHEARFVFAADASHWTCTDYEIIKFAAMIAAAEREACAKVCEEATLKNWFAEDCVALIRERNDL
jgi:hypothetical protein